MLRALADSDEIAFPLAGGMERPHLRERAGFLDMAESALTFFWEDVEPHLVAAYRSGGVVYQFREIGEGEGWQDCSESNYERFQRDAYIDTRTVAAPSGQALADENALLRVALERARNVLGNMALEHTTGWRGIFARWPIHHEPLRSDARAVLPVIDAALGAGNE